MNEIEQYEFDRLGYLTILGPAEWRAGGEPGRGG